MPKTIAQEIKPKTQNVLRFAKILLNIPIPGPFDYKIPKSMAGKIQRGSRVWVNFGTRRLVGYVCGFSEKSNFSVVKEIDSLIDDEPILNEEILEFTRQISDYYLCGWGEAIEAAIPSGIKKGKTHVGARKKEKEDNITPTTDLNPTKEQKQALDKIIDAITEKKHKTFLLHGVTSSGKTEVYLQAINKVLKAGASCIVLVPEIALTPQAIERFKSRFKEKVALLHSRLSHGQRFQEWKKIKDGTCHIVVGARSAIFAPVKNLGLIIVDEEHDTSYKQQDAPRYHATNAAIMRSRLNNAVVVLGSATPSLESYYKAQNKEYTLLELKKRIQERPLPAVSIVDMREEIVQRRNSRIIFSRILKDSIYNTLSKKEQAILFLNRRGFSTYANCKKCGYVFKCKKCNIALNYHYDKKKLICHHCNYQINAVEICPKCNSSYVSYFGFGTQRVESELHRFFPTSGIARMDTDSTAKGYSHKQILKDFASGKSQILIGTQMVAKGHDFPQVTLVGVVLADTALNLPDFRAGERTFQLLTQVAGRAGRGAAKGRVIIQTYAPSHYAIISSIEHDYKSFYKKEIAFRKELLLPPFSNIITITLRSYVEEKSETAAKDLAKYLKDEKLKSCFEVMGPSPDIIYRLRRQFRWRVILSIKNLAEANEQLKQALKKFKISSSVRMAVDVDPA